MAAGHDQLVRPVSASASPTDPLPRLIDRVPPGLVNFLTIAGFAVPILGYFLFVAHFSVNVILGDQWDDVTVIRSSYGHFPDWSALWLPHNENRIFFPNLIVIALAHTVHFNITIEEFLGAFLLIGAYVLLILAHRRRSPSTPWLYYCPVMLLGLALPQWENMLWGFQLAWFLVILSFAATIFFLDRPALTLPVFGAALLLAIVGSYSSLQGLLIWPAGLILLYFRQRRPAFLVGWVVIGAVTTFWYFHNFPNMLAGESRHYALHHLVVSLRFFLFEIGDVVGLNPGPGAQANGAVLTLGAVIFVAAIATLIVHGVRRPRSGGGPIGIALIIFGLLFAVVVTLGRVIQGYHGAGQSRYVTYNLLIPIGIFLVIVSPRLSGDRPLVGMWLSRWGTTVLRWLLVGLIPLVLVIGIHYGIDGAQRNYAYQSEGAKILEHIDTEPDNKVAYLYVYFPASYVRGQARIAKQLHLSLFASP